jgi:hypothetical protein
MFRFFSRKPEFGPQPLFRFYDGALRSRPDNVTIIDMHHWRGDYDTLEDKHGAAYVMKTMWAVYAVEAVPLIHPPQAFPRVRRQCGGAR